MPRGGSPRTPAAVVTQRRGSPRRDIVAGQGVARCASWVRQGYCRGVIGPGETVDTECTMTDSSMPPLTADELAAEGGTALPDKEVISLLDLNADLDIGLDAAAPIDLAVAANANVAAPIDAAVGANILSAGSEAQAMADQGVLIDQG